MPFPQEIQYYCKLVFLSLTLRVGLYRGGSGVYKPTPEEEAVERGDLSDLLLEVNGNKAW